MAQTRGEELAEQIKDIGVEIALMMFEGRHAEARYVSEVLVAQGELMLGFYQEEMSPDELQTYRDRLASITMQE